MIWVLGIWIAFAVGCLGIAGWHQLTIHTGPYEYCLWGYLGLVLGVVAAIVFTTKRAALAPSGRRFPIVARFCAVGAGLCVMGLGGVFGLLGLKFLFPVWFAAGPTPPQELDVTPLWGGVGWILMLVFALLLGALGLGGILWGLVLLTHGLFGPGTLQETD
jgi:hypothetical protein